MPFGFKLSHRLSRIRRVAVSFTGAALVACVPGDQSISDPPQIGSSTIQSSSTTATVLLQEDFEATGFGTRGWYDFRSDPTLTDTTHALGSARALEVRFAAGAQTPPWVAARHVFQPSPTLYVSYWVRYSANWVGSQRTYHPHEFQIMSDLDGDYGGLSNGWLVAYIEQVGGTPRLALQDSKAINTSYGTPPINLTAITENRSIGGCNGVVEANVVLDCFSFPPWYNLKQMIAPQVMFKSVTGPGYKGNWNHVEAYFAMNSVVNGIGQADGVMQYWFNGQLVIDRRNVQFRTGARPNIKFRQFVIAPYIGDGSPVNQTMWIDNLTVATAPTAVAPPPPPPGVVSVASVVVSPATASLVAGQTRQLAATLKDASGNLLTGRTVTWASSNAAVATVDATGLVAAKAAGSATITATSEGKSGTAAISVTAPTKPGKVTDLAVAATIDSGVTLSFTEVTDGAAKPAKYDVRYRTGKFSWSTAASVTRGTCATPMAGSAIGAKRTCTVLGLKPATAYTFQLVAFRGTMNLNAVYGPLSNIVSATTKPAVAPVASVVVSPASATVVAGQTVQLTATLKDASGTVLTGRSVIWTSSNAGVATVSASGLVTGVASGSATITAASEAKTGTAAITVTAVVTNPGTVSNLRVAAVSDKGVTLSFTEVSGGAGQPASYNVRYAVGPISWGAAASVTQGTCATPMAGTAIGAARTCTVLGLQPNTAYQFQLVAFRGTMNLNAVYGALSNVASATTAAGVVAPPPPPPPAPSGGLWPNQPAEFTAVTERSFDLLSEAGWSSSGPLLLVPDLTAPKSGGSVGQITYPAGFAGGSQPAFSAVSGVNARGYTQLYVSFWVKLSSNWQGHSSGVNKIGFVWLHGNPCVFFVPTGSGSGPLEARLWLQNVPLGGRQLAPNVNPNVYTRGEWHRWEVLLVANTGDLANGEAHWWIDGAKVGEYRDIVYGTSAQSKFWGDELSWRPIWGGIGGTVSQTMFMWMDHYYASGR